MEYSAFDANETGILSFNTTGNLKYCLLCQIHQIESNNQTLTDKITKLNRANNLLNETIAELENNITKKNTILYDLRKKIDELQKISEINIATITDTIADESYECPICMSHDYTSDTLNIKSFIKTSCGYIFHGVCFMVWISDKTDHKHICPMCRNKNVIQSID